MAWIIRPMCVLSLDGEWGIQSISVMFHTITKPICWIPLPRISDESDANANEWIEPMWWCPCSLHNRHWRIDDMLNERQDISHWHFCAGQIRLWRTIAYHNLLTMSSCHVPSHSRTRKHMATAFELWKCVLLANLSFAVGFLSPTKTPT